MREVSRKKMGSMVLDTQVHVAFETIQLTIYICKYINVPEHLYFTYVLNEIFVLI